MTFWSGKRVLITGHTGFKGGWLALMLEQEGAHLTGLSLPAETEPNLFTLAGVDKAVDSHFGDIRSAEFVNETISRARPEVVFHLAAQALVRRSYTDPAGTFATNVLGSIHVFEAVRRTPSVGAIVNTTSDKCYENGEVLRPYRESDPMGGSDPYSGSKGCAELAARAWRKSFFNDRMLVSVRAGNVIGGGDWSEDRLVPDCMRAFQRGEPVRLRNPDSLRPWQHVLDPLSGYLLAAEQILAGKPLAAGYNFGPPAEPIYRVEEVVTAAARHWGGGAAWALDQRPSPPESRLLLLDSTLARRDLGWRPRLSFDDCVAWTVEWYRKQAAGEDMRAFTRRQIERYWSLPAEMAGSAGSLSG